MKDNVTHTAVGYDGNWKGRKNTCGYVVGGVTDIITGVVTDSEILSNLFLSKEEDRKTSPRILLLV